MAIANALSTNNFRKFGSGTCRDWGASELARPVLVTTSICLPRGSEQIKWFSPKGGYLIRPCFMENSQSSNQTGEDVGRQTGEVQSPLHYFKTFGFDQIGKRMNNFVSLVTTYS